MVHSWWCLMLHIPWVWMVIKLWFNYLTTNVLLGLNLFDYHEYRWIDKLILFFKNYIVVHKLFAIKGWIHIFILVDKENKHQNLKSFIILDFFIFGFLFVFFTSFRFMPRTHTWIDTYYFGGWLILPLELLFWSLACRIPYLIIIVELNLNVVEVNLLRSHTLFFLWSFLLYTYLAFME